jgi:hypothetical protein
MREAEAARALLHTAQEDLRSRFDDFRQAFDRRDEAAYRLALTDFHDRLCDWTAAEERALVPALRRAGLADRDPRRELSLEYVQLRELTRQIRLGIDGRAPLADLLGLVENLGRRLEAHERGNRDVYYPAAADALTDEETRALRDAARGN